MPRRRRQQLAAPPLDLPWQTREYLAETGTGREPSIEYLTGRLELPVHTPHHALGDALSTAQLFLVLAARLGGETLTARDLLALSRANTRR